jgi:parallel beta-helix repeat protein
MTRQGLHNQRNKNLPSSLGNRMNTQRALPAILTALIVASGTSTIVPAFTNNGATNAQTPVRTVQTPATGTILYVNPTSGNDAAGAGTAEATPFKSITFALRQAQPGTIIQLAPGTYNKESGEVFPLVIPEKVTLRGDESSKGQSVLISGSGAYTSRTFARQNITILAGNETVISGLTVTNPDSRGTGVWVESTNPTIQNSTFTQSVREGVFVTGTGNPKIENNIFTLNQGNGVSVARDAKGEIRNNLFQNTGFGIAVSDKASPLITDNQINQNNGGIVITSSGTNIARPILRNNVIQDNRDHGVIAISTAEPDLGTQESPGKNLIRNNGKKDPKKFFDIYNFNANKTLTAVGNDVDPTRTLGKIELVVAKVEPPVVEGGATAFKDVTADYWAKAHIEALASRNIIAGFPDGTFKPNEPVTRAQFAAIIAKAFNPVAKREAANFTDVRNNFWAFQVIQTAARGGFISGYPDRTFKPEQQIERVQVLVALANGLGLTAPNASVNSFFSDAGRIPNYAATPVAAATARGLVVNYPTVRQLNPTRQATRAEVAAFVYQALVNAGQAQAIPSPYIVRTP